MEIKKDNNSKVIPIKNKSKCPTCKRLSKEPFIPFCSKKCASLDLMKWLGDEYEINLNSD